MKPLAGMSALLAIALGLAGWAGNGRASTARVSGGSSSLLHSSALILGRRVRCTATVRPDVQVGHDLSVRFTLRNVSKRAVKLSNDVGAVLKAADGTVYDPGAPLRGLPRPPLLSTKLRASATRSAGRLDIPVRWTGPLAIKPRCGSKPLHVLRVDVESPGPPSNDTSAISEVVSATGHLLDRCRPQTPGTPVYGEIDAPSGSAPPMSAACSLSVDSEGTFSVAQVLILIPPGLSGVTVQQPYELFGPPFTPFSPPTVPPPYEAIAWEFVVTREGALSVAAATAAGTNVSSSGAIEPSFAWNGTTWEPAGTGTCGGQGFSWGPSPLIEFISACPS
jgi:hypothetical protein